MADLIKRQAAIEKLKREFNETDVPDRYPGVFDAIEEWLSECELPSAQPETIRCKECRHYEWMGNRVQNEQTWFCHKWIAETGKDDYCSYAERREE